MIIPKLICNYLLKKEGTSDQLTATVLDSNNNPVKNHNVVFNIHGVDYTRRTDDSGIARLNINLGAGSYPATATVEGDNNYYSVSKGVLVQVVNNKVSPTVTVENLTKVYATPTPLIARLTYDGNAIVGKTVRFNINGVTYDRTTNVDGEASLNINLEPGTYTATVSSVSDDVLNSVSKSATVVVNQSQATPTLTVSNLTKKWGSSTSLNANLSVNGEALTNRKITFNINGVTYERTTNSQGDVSLNINLNPGTYSCIVTKPEETYYRQVTRTVTVTVQKATPKIEAPNLTKKFKGSEPFQVYAANYNNEPLANEVIQLTVNGVTYNRTTNEKGITSLNINLNPGTYGINVVALENTFYEQVSLNRTIVVDKQDTFMDGTNITKYAKDTAVYQCAIYNEQGERVLGKVNFRVNGVDYQRTTESDGLAKLNIRLWTGEYTIQAWYSGDEFYRGSSIINTITVKPNGGTKTAIDGESVTDIKSKIYIGGHSDATQLQALDNNILSLFEKSEYPEGVPFTEYEINETDRRTKTAKFTTPISLDLTANFTYVIITNPYHEDFGGVVLSVDYDADKDLYNYQCQDWRRRYISKSRTLDDSESHTVYETIEELLILPHTNEKVSIELPLSNELKKQYSRALSGLRPLNEYNQVIGVLKAQNYMEKKLEKYLTYDSTIDKIFNLTLGNGANLDIWFDKYGVCHLDPIDWEYWLNTGLLLTTEDMAEYKYGFDTTNILTGVRVKNADYTTRAFLNNYTYPDGVAKKVSEDLAIIFGNNVTVVEGPKTQTTTNTNSSSSGSSSSSTGYNSCGKSTDGTQIMAIGRPSAAGESSYGYTFYKSVFKNYCPHCGKATLNWGIFWAGNETSNWGKFPCTGLNEGGSAEGHIFCSNCDADYSCILGKEHVSGGKTLTRISGPEKSTKEEAYKLKNGQMAGSSTTNTSTTNSETGTTENTVDINDPAYIAEQYRLAVAEYSKSVRSLMKFSIKIPLNDPVYKQLHTNSFLFTDLPEKFALINLPQIYKNLASYNVSRGVPYVKNRWYIEAVKIKCDSKGLWADVTLNAFPTDQSSYSSAMKGYISAWDSAFNFSSDTTTTNTTNTTSSNIPARTDGKTDCSPAYSLSYVHTGATDNPLNHKKPDANAYGKIGRDGTNYANFVKGCSSPREVFKKLSNAGWNGSNKYRRFSGEAQGSSCVEGIFKQNYANCAGMSKLLKACMDVCGFKCAIAHVSDHYMNVVEVNGKWESCDLCYQSGKYPGYQSAGFNK